MITRNIQTIPRDQKDVKQAFVPKLDAFLSLDYPNIELKLLAWYLEQLKHPSMADVFRRGDDLHLSTAAGLMGITYEAAAKRYDAKEEAVDLWRQVGKKLNFSIVYGGGTPTLMKQLSQPEPDGLGRPVEFPEALDMLKKFHGAWPGIGWQTKTRQANDGTLAWHIHKQIDRRCTRPGCKHFNDKCDGYITTLWGRHLHPESAHKALNALVQGCAADLMKWALIQIHRYLKEHKMRSHLVVTVHDNAMLDCAKNELEELCHVVPDLMTYLPVGDLVPIRPEPEVSFETWADLQAIQSAGWKES